MIDLARYYAIRSPGVTNPSKAERFRDGPEALTSRRRSSRPPGAARRRAHSATRRDRPVRRSERLSLPAAGPRPAPALARRSMIATSPALAAARAFGTTVTVCSPTERAIDVAVTVEDERSPARPLWRTGVAKLRLLGDAGPVFLLVAHNSGSGSTTSASSPIRRARRCAWRASRRRRNAPPARQRHRSLPGTCRRVGPGNPAAALTSSPAGV